MSDGWMLLHCRDGQRLAKKVEKKQNLNRICYSHAIWSFPGLALGVLWLDLGISAFRYTGR